MRKIPDSDVNNVEPMQFRRRSHSKKTKFGRYLKKHGLRRRVLITMFIVIIVGSIMQIVLLVDGINQLNISFNAFNRVYSSLIQQQSNELTLTDFDRLQASITEMSNSITTLDNRIVLVRPLSTLNVDWSVRLNQLDAASELIKASQEILNGLQPVLFFLLDDSDDTNVASRISGGARIVELLEIGHGQFLSASQHLMNASQILNSIPLENVTPDLLLQIGNLEDFYTRLESINESLVESPELLTFVLGLNEQRVYLLLAMNNDEIRPSGGYLSTYGWIVIRDGRIVDYDYSPTTTTSPLPPVDSAAIELVVPEWWIQYDQPLYAAWDGSWYADYPSTAEMAMWYYNSGNNRHAPVDGVIAIDITAFEYLLAALGTVEVPGYSRTITSSNFRNVVYDIRAFGQGVNPHKQFVADVFKAIFADWQSSSGDIDQNNALISAALQALQERHMMIYFTEPDLNHVVNQLNWSGTQKSVEGHDYLMVVDANLGNKSNNSIVRQLTYDVNLQLNDTSESTLTVAYEYPASLADNDPAVDPDYHGPLDYGNLLQVFTPRGTILNTTNGLSNQVDIDESLNYTNFISLMTVEYDTSARVQFQYTTPIVVKKNGDHKSYQLFIQKQPGSHSNRVNVQVSLPPDSEIISSTPQPVQSYTLDNLILDFRFDLITDQHIEIIYEVR